MLQGGLFVCNFCIRFFYFMVILFFSPFVTVCLHKALIIDISGILMSNLFFRLVRGKTFVIKQYVLKLDVLLALKFGNIPLTKVMQFAQRF